MSVLKSVAVWLLILCLAMINGILREELLLPALGMPAALIASGTLLSIVILLVACLSVRYIGVASSSHALAVGALWLCLTLVFEFGFGRLVQHKSWTELLVAYTFEDGNIWPLVLLVTLLAPLIAFRLYRK
jgi:hypothetical protein